MKKSEKETLRGCAVFNGLTQQEFDCLVIKNSFTVTEYPKHTVIFSPQSYPKALALILKGSADVYKNTREGTLFLSVLQAGQLFGMANLFCEQDGFINTVSAKEDCRILFITKQQLLDIFTRYPVCLQNYLCLLSQKIHYLNSKIEYLSVSSPEDRLYTWLREQADAQNGDSVLCDVSYKRLANTLSLGRTSLYKAMDVLEKRGVIQRQGKVIRVKNL